MTTQTLNLIEQLVKNARIAQQEISCYNQDQLDQLTHAVAWAVMEETRNLELSTMACAETGLGNIEDKQIKNYRKTLGLLRDLKGQISTGLLNEKTQLGISEYARPIGVVAALVPSTNPVATPINKIINSLKSGNSVIVAPSPKGAKVFEKLLGYIKEQLQLIKAPKNLVQMLPLPPTKEATNQLMKSVDLVVVTGSQNNVRNAYESGTPAIGVGAGNVTIIIDKSAKVHETVAMIKQSKTFDNGTSCSSENNLIIDHSIYQSMIDELEKQGTYLLNESDKIKLLNAFWQDGVLNKQLIAKKAKVIAQACQIDVPESTTMLAVSVDCLKTAGVLAKERMAPILTLFKSTDFESATELCKQIMLIQGAGHSLGIHTQEVESQARSLAQTMPTCRVIVNQAHTMATGGSFNNGMPFSLSMGCGSWGGNSIDGNLNYKHYMNITKIVRPITPNEPNAQEILQKYLDNTQQQ